jgi:hypothetical protein
VFIIKRKIWNPILGIIPFFCALFLALMWTLPFLFPTAEAYGQLTSRSLSISSGVPSDTGVTYTFTFTPQNTNQVQGMKFKACTNAIGTYPTGTCTAPAGMTVSGDGFTNAAFVSQTGWQPNGTSFAIDATGAFDCVPSPNIICVNRSDTTAHGFLRGYLYLFND